MNGLKRSGVVGVLSSVMALSMSMVVPADCAPQKASAKKAAANPAAANPAAIKTASAAAAPDESRGIRIGAKDLYYKQLADNSFNSNTNKDIQISSIPSKNTTLKLGNMGLNFGIELRRNDQAPVSVGTHHIFQSGDGIQFKVKSNIDGYMYVFMTHGSTGKRAQLYPPPNHPQEDNKIEKGITYTVPDGGLICFDNNPGIETLQLCLSPKPMNAEEVLNSSRGVTIIPKGGHAPVVTKSDTTLVAFEDVDAAAKQHFQKIGAINNAGSTFAVTTDTSKPLTIDLVLQHNDPNKPLPTVTANANSGPTKIASAPPTTTRTIPTTAVNPAASEQIMRAAIQDKWALVVGISKHKNSSLDLRFPHKDAQDFANYLINEGHFAPDHVHTLINEQATKANILTEMGETFLPINAKPGDLVVVYIAGHGTGSDQDVAHENFLVAYDTDTSALYATAINMNDFVRELKKRVKTDRVLLVLDTCHAGAAGAKALPGLGSLFKFNPIPQGTGQLVIASSSADQRSHDSRRYSNGIFTKHLIDGLRKHQDVNAAFAYTQRAVQSEATEDFKESQTPLIKEAEWKGAKLVLKAPPVKPRQALEVKN